MKPASRSTEEFSAGLSDALPHTRVPWRCFALASALAFALSGCGGGSSNAIEPAPAEVPSAEIDAGRGAAITLSAPQAVAGSNRISLHWRAHSKALSFSVLLQRSENDRFVTVAEGLRGNSTIIDRGAAWRLDFPTARVKVRGCNPGHRCTDSNEQPLLSALMAGVITLRSDLPDPSLDLSNPQPVHFDSFSNYHALDGKGNTLAATTADFLYVFGRDTTGKWQPPTKLPFGAASNPVWLSRDGNTMAVLRTGETGTHGGINPPPGPDDGDFSTSPFFGAAYVFVRNAQGEWHQQVHIRQDVRQTGDFFGTSASLSSDGNRLAVLAVGSSTRAYLYARDGAGVWHQETILSDPPKPFFETFRGPVAFSGNGRVLAIGGAGQLDDSFNSVFLFVDLYAFTPQTGWLLQGGVMGQRNFDAMGLDAFGETLALDHDGTTVAVAAPEDSSDDTDTVGDPRNRNAPQSGAVYIFKRSSAGAWEQQAFLKARGAASGDRFGRSGNTIKSGIALSQNGRVLIGTAVGLAANAPGINRNNEADRTSGALPGDTTGTAAYVFRQSDEGTWSEIATAIPPVIGRSTSSFFSLSLSGDGKTYALGAEANQLEGTIITTRPRVYVY
jgi:hypothetical protein